MPFTQVPLNNFKLIFLVILSVEFDDVETCTRDVTTALAVFWLHFFLSLYLQLWKQFLCKFQIAIFKKQPIRVFYDKLSRDRINAFLQLAAAPAKKSSNESGQMKKGTSELIDFGSTWPTEIKLIKRAWQKM